MKYYSEKLNKIFDTSEEVEKAEKEHEEKVKKEEADKKALTEKRAARAKEVENAFNELLKAKEKYHNLRDEFVKDYKSFHMTFKSVNDGLKSFIDYWFD